MVTPEQLGIRQLHIFGLDFEDGDSVPLRLQSRDLQAVMIRARRKGLSVNQYLAYLVIKHLEEHDDFLF